LFNTPQDTNEALDILKRYTAGSPEHRAGLRESQSWWWRSLKDDPRFKAIVAN
jgi:hypothetical protein